MATYALKKFLRNTPNILLQQYFQNKSLLDDFAWPLTKNGKTREIGETEIDPLDEAITSLEDQGFIDIEADFRDITDMADDTGVACLMEQAKALLFGIDLAKVFDDNNIEGYYARSIYVFLEHPKLFGFAHQNQHIESLANWKECEVGDGLSCKTDDEAKETLAKEIAAYFKDKGQGKNCKVDYYYRQKPDRDCFFAYPEDCAKPELAYRRGELKRVPRRPVSEVVFMYDRKTGLLSVYSPRIRNVESLQRIFCQKMLGLKDLPNNSTLVYDLSKLKDKYFRFETEPIIERVKLKMLALDLTGGDGATLVANPSDGNELALCQRMVAVAKAYGIDLTRVIIKKAKLQVVFRSENGKKSKTVTFTIVSPSPSGLEDTFHHNIIKRHIENKWGFRRKLIDGKPGTTEAA